MAAGLGSGRTVSATYSPIRVWLMLPSWLIIGFFLALPVLLMLVYSFLTKEFRGGVIWDPTLTAYDQFLFDRGLFGDDPPTIQWAYVTIFARSIAQAAAAAALSQSQDIVHEMREIFKKRRAMIVEMLNAIPGVSCASPDGAFYVFPDVSACFTEKVPNSLALCEHLLESAHVAAVPGSAFGAEGHLRMSFACSDAQIEEGIKRLREGLNGLA